MITIEGTVRVILGKPTLRFIAEARSPDESAPMNAAAPAGSPVISISSSLSVFATTPISPAVAAIFTGLLNISENPNTPTKLAIAMKTP